VSMAPETTQNGSSSTTGAEHGTDHPTRGAPDKDDIAQHTPATICHERTIAMAIKPRGKRSRDGICSGGSDDRRPMRQGPLGGHRPPATGLPVPCSGGFAWRFRWSGSRAGDRQEFRAGLPRWSALTSTRSEPSWGQAAPPTDVSSISGIRPPRHPSSEPRPRAGEQQPAAETNSQHELIAGKGPEEFA